MALARIQTSIVKHLLEMGHLSDAQFQAIIHTDQDMTGNAIEALLLEKYQISAFQVLVAKAHAFKLPPVNVKH